MNNLDIKDLKENTTHGDFILPFTVYSCEFSEIYYTVQIHWHEEIELTLVDDGIGEYKIDLVPYELEKGDIILVKPFSLHSIHQINSTNMNWRTMVFNLNMLNSAVTDGCLIKYFAPIFNNEHELPVLIKKNSKGYSELYNIISKIFDCYNSKDIAYEIELKSLLYHFFALLYKYDLIVKNKAASLSSEVTNKMKIILNYIKENYMNDISIKDMCSICNFSEYHFMRFFKKYIGMTCIEYINNYRLEVASKLLDTTDKSIMDISFEVGFNNVSYFNKLFKTKFKLTPREFRDINQKIYKA
ncbi:helix-turn-helix domain-containing protein [Clostridium sp. C2-6-12]|uniref:AraC family transcriptional regulator n=1 Tax=Clostridium sp. C2-6-12 TaxID=2698832 RepID=UPI00136D1985|nr:helix-turn-helix domain-containing protein [Clostridium sp. C2-6-12]